MSDALDPRLIGPFPNAVQIVAPLSSETHELLTDPQKGTGTGTLTYHGGALLTAPSWVNVYVNLDPIASFDAFAKDCCENGFIDGEIRNYRGVPQGKTVVPGRFLGSFSLVLPLPGTVLDSTIQGWIDGLVARTAPSGVDAQTIYFLVMPPNSQVQFDGNTTPSGSSCTGFCGYHSKTTGGRYYAVICDTACAGCHGGFSPTDGRTMITSHEYGEAVTDPEGTGWYDDGDGSENGDKCAWKLVRWGPIDPATGLPKWAVQPVFTNEHQCAYVAPYVAPSTGGSGGGSGGSGLPQPHFTLAGPLANVWNFLIAHPDVLALLGTAGLTPGSNEQKFWTWVEQNASAESLIQILNSPGWFAWWTKQTALAGTPPAITVDMPAPPEVA